MYETTDHQAERLLEKRTMRKVAWRLIPYLFLLYIIAYLDRVNLGYAALEMNQALGVTSEVFGMAAGIFFFGYFIFEVPSNVLLHRLGARVWIARILVSWGVVVVLTAWVQNGWQLYALRFILGVAEAGFFPGIILYITYWFRPHEQARAVAFFMTALAASSMIGAPVSTWIIDHIRWLGMDGWRWMFILEGIPAIVFGLITLFYLTDRPEAAHWLKEEERTWLIAALAQEESKKAPVTSMWDALKEGRVWYFSLIYFTLVVGLYGIGFWMPTIVKALTESADGTFLTNTQVGLIVMIPYIFGGVAMVLWGLKSDKAGERRWHAALPAFIGALGLIGSGMFTDPFTAVFMMTIATMGIYSFFGPFWSYANAFLSGGAAAVGIAVINSIGNLGGFVGPYMIGYLKEFTGTNKAGLYFLSGSLFVSFLLIVWSKYLNRQTLSAPSQQPSQQKQKTSL